MWPSNRAAPLRFRQRSGCARPAEPGILVKFVAGITFDSHPIHASHRVDVAVGTWLTALLVMAAFAWGGMALTAAVALIARR
jgi:hypothetical protein